jgi:LacI family transcriptional regulator
MGITIKQIAVIAKVSPATVSLALNNKPGISARTREKILAIADTLRQESEGRQVFPQVIKGSIRFLKIIKHGHVVNRDHDHFIAEYIDGIDKEARRNGYNLEINTLMASEIKHIVQHLKTANIEGVIILGTELSCRDIKAFDGIRLPLVFIDTAFDVIKYDFVTMNNRIAIFELIKYLKNNNHRKIGFIGTNVEARNIHLRENAFLQSLKYYDLPLNRKFIFTIASTFQAAYQDMADILKLAEELPTALLAANDLMASACMKAFREFGIKVPDDISITGFDNLPMCEMLDPPLTTMDVSKQQIGRQAMRIIVDRINDNLNDSIIKCHVGGKLIVRGSVRKISKSQPGQAGIEE